MSSKRAANDSIVDVVVAMRSRRHTEHHATFADVAEGRLELVVRTWFVRDLAAIGKLDFERAP